MFDKEIRNNCSNCPYSTYGDMDPLSDMCDGCMEDSDTGWYGYTDHSISDSDGNHPHFTNIKENYISIKDETNITYKEQEAIMKFYGLL